MQQLCEEFVFSCIPPRAQESHKGSYGHLLAVAGSRRYRGAAGLATEGALRTGAGIVTLASVEPVIAALRAGVTTVMLPEENRKDADELPEEVRSKLEIHFVGTFEEAEKFAFRRPSAREKHA